MLNAYQVYSYQLADKRMFLCLAESDEMVRLILNPIFNSKIFIHLLLAHTDPCHIFLIDKYNKRGTIAYDSLDDWDTIKEKEFIHYQTREEKINNLLT